MSDREKLTSNRTYYVRSDGSDANDGLTDSSAGAFLTIAHALTNIAREIDCGDYQITISVGAGTFSTAIHWAEAVPGQNGNRGICISGAGNSTILDGGGLPVISVVEANARLMIENLKLQTTNNNLLESHNGGVVVMGPGVAFGSAGAGTHIVSIGGGLVLVLNDYTIIGGAAYHILASDGGKVLYNTGGITVTLAASFTATAFILCARVSIVRVGYATYSLGAFTVSGKRYDVSENGIVSAFGAGVNFLPGTIAGSESSGGHYT